MLPSFLLRSVGPKAKAAAATRCAIGESLWHAPFREKGERVLRLNKRGARTGLQYKLHGRLRDSVLTSTLAYQSNNATSNEDRREGLISKSLIIHNLLARHPCRYHPVKRKLLNIPVPFPSSFVHLASASQRISPSHGLGPRSRDGLKTKSRRATGSPCAPAAAAAPAPARAHQATDERLYGVVQGPA